MELRLAVDGRLILDSRLGGFLTGFSNPYSLSKYFL